MVRLLADDVLHGLFFNGNRRISISFFVDMLHNGLLAIWFRSNVIEPKKPLIEWSCREILCKQVIIVIILSLPKSANIFNFTHEIVFQNHRLHAINAYHFHMVGRVSFQINHGGKHTLVSIWVNLCTDCCVLHILDLQWCWTYYLMLCNVFLFLFSRKKRSLQKRHIPAIIRPVSAIDGILIYLVDDRRG